MQTYTIEAVREKGFAHGASLVIHNHHDATHYRELLQQAEVGEVVDANMLNEWRQSVYSITADADDCFRQYSPFEFFADALNGAENGEELWEAYDEGISTGIAAQIALVEKTRFNSEN